jgi:hypothetical protein
MLEVMCSFTWILPNRSRAVASHFVDSTHAQHREKTI